MGVVRKRVVVAQAEDGSSAPPEETTPPSEAGSEENEPIATSGLRRQRVRNRSLNHSYEIKTPNSHTGKRKVRRHANEKTLMIYLKDDDEDPNCLLETYRDPFARLMDASTDPIELLNDFTYRLEQESKTDEVEKQDLTPFQRISNKIRRAMKLKKKFPLVLVEGIENDIVGFFVQNPQDIFCCVPPKSFERLLFHAVSQYHGLHSISLAKNGHICVEVQNNSGNWIPIALRLSQYLSQVNN